jgi:hypothetical protein
MAEKGPTFGYGHSGDDLREELDRMFDTSHYEPTTVTRDIAEARMRNAGREVRDVHLPDFDDGSEK